MNYKILAFSLTLSFALSLNAYAGTPYVPLFPGLPKSTAIQELQPFLPPDQLQSILETAHVVHAWNPETNERALVEIFSSRVSKLGITAGLVMPQLALVDAAIISKRDSIARIMIPSISRVAPNIASDVVQKLRLQPIGIQTSFAKQSLEDIRNEAMKMISDRHGSNARESLIMPDLMGDWRRIDPTGISAALFGPGSYIHDASEMGGYDPMDRGPMMGMSMDDVKACYSRCSGAVKHGAEIGATVGKYVGGVAGTVIGAGISGGPGAGIGLGAGIGGGEIGGGEIGGGEIGGGEIGGGIVGGAIGWGMCASKSCNGGSDSPSTPSTPSSGGGSESGGTTSPSDPPTDSGGSDDPPSDSGGGSDDPPTNDDGGGSDSGGGSDNCHPGDDSCSGMQINDTDRDPDPGITDTGVRGSIVLRAKHSRYEGIPMDNSGNRVDPIRPDGFNRGRFGRLNSMRRGH